MFIWLKRGYRFSNRMLMKHPDMHKTMMRKCFIVESIGMRIPNNNNKVHSILSNSSQPIKTRKRKEASKVE
jgi:hypothetical protein